MFASMRRYRLRDELAGEFARRVDDSFADQIAAQPGFVSYELIDCGDGDLFSLSIFLEPAQAEASRELARAWTEERLVDIEHTRFDAIHGESVVGRAAPGMLEAIHPGAAGKRVSIRLDRLRSGTVRELLRRVDVSFADRMGEMAGFEASHLLDCGDGEVLWVNVTRDEGALTEADQAAAEFRRDELGEFRPECIATIRGAIAVSRANAELLEPTHAG